jgi:hypothetical protein
MGAILPISIDCGILMFSGFDDEKTWFDDVEEFHQARRTSR